MKSFCPPGDRATAHGDAGRAPARGRAHTTPRRALMPPSDDVDEHIDPEDEIAFEDADAADREAEREEEGSEYGSDEDFDATEVRSKSSRAGERASERARWRVEARASGR